MNECETDTAVHLQAMITLDYNTTDPSITKEIRITETFSTNNSDAYISTLVKTGEESFQCITNISETIIFPPTPRPTKGPPT